MNRPKVKGIREGGKLKTIITVPNLTVPISKLVNTVMKNPVDIQLDMYSSQNPDLLDPMDLKMMSKLDRLRTHADLRDKNRKQDKDIKQQIDKFRKSAEKASQMAKEREIADLKANQKTDTNNGK